MAKTKPQTAHVPSFTSTGRWSQPLNQSSKAVLPDHLDVLAQWTPPAMATQRQARKPVNVVFVLDRSGSMNETLSGEPWYGQGVPPLGVASPLPGIVGPAVSAPTHHPALRGGVAQNAQQNALNILENIKSAVEAPKRKIDLAKEAARMAIASLQDEDRVSLVVFDTHVQVLCEGVSGQEKARLNTLLNAVEPGSSTALFDGWGAGARALANTMKEGMLNRVIMLTDGNANCGERNLDVIAARVAQLADTGITTSTFGVGRDYNEDLLQAMADAGDGNYYYIQGNDDFLALFEDEFQGLTRLVGKKARLSIEAPGWSNVDVLNDLTKDEQGRYRLPNLVGGKTIDVVVRATPTSKSPAPLRLVVSYEDAQGRCHEETLTTVPALVRKASEMVVDQDVVDRAAMLLVARQKKVAMAAMDQGNLGLASATLRGASAFMSNASAALADDQQASLNGLMASLDSGDAVGTRKAALYQSYNVMRSKHR